VLQVGYLDLARQIMTRLPTPSREAGPAVNVGATPPATGQRAEPEVWDSELLRLLEADLGQPAGSLRWIDPPGQRCRGCPWCE
jgi:hypothetical protein